MSEVVERGPVLQPGQEAPGRWVPDKHPDLPRVWQGVSEWVTRHGQATVQWTFARESYIWNARMPDGSRVNASSMLPARGTFRRHVNDSYEHGAIEVSAEDVTFTPIANADLPKLDVIEEHRCLFDLLSRDATFMNALGDVAVAQALYSVIENASFMLGANRYDFGQRSAGRFVAALRDSGEEYFDFAWSSGAEDQLLQSVRAHFERLGISPAPQEG